MATKTTKIVQNSQHRSWITRRAKMAATTAVAVPTPRAKRSATSTTGNRTLSLDGMRKLRASVPTLVGHLNSSKSVEYYYSTNRSIIVVNN